MSANRPKSVQTAEQHMPAVTEARAMLCAVPLDLSRGESKGVWLLRASRLHEIPAALGKRLYYREVKKMDADTLDRMRRRSQEIESLNRRIEALKAAEARHKEESHALRLAIGSPPRPGRSGPADVDSEAPPRAGGVVRGPAA